LYDIAPDELVIHPVMWATMQDIYLPEDYQRILQHCRPKTGGLNPYEDTLVCFQLPSDVAKAPVLPNTFVYTMLETTGIAPQWAEIINSIKGCIVPCAGNIQSFKSCGANNVQCVPPAADYSIFNPEPRDGALVLENLNKFNVFCSVQVSPRKNLPELVSAYCDTFGKEKDATLFVKAHGQGYSTVEMFDIADEVKRLKKGMKANIVLIYDTVSDYELADIYRQMDMYMTASFGESWDYPRFESLVCGVPAIGTAFIGPDMYLSDEAFRVKYQLMDVGAPPNPIYTTGQMWARPEPIDLRRKMTAVYKNPKMYKDKALKLSEKIRETYTWEKSAKALLDIVKKEK